MNGGSALRSLSRIGWTLVSALRSAAGLERGRVGGVQDDQVLLLGHRGPLEPVVDPVGLDVVADDEVRHLQRLRARRDVEVVHVHQATPVRLQRDLQVLGLTAVVVVLEEQRARGRVERHRADGQAGARAGSAAPAAAGETRERQGTHRRCEAGATQRASREVSGVRGARSCRGSRLEIHLFGLPIGCVVFGERKRVRSGEPPAAWNAAGARRGPAAGGACGAAVDSDALGRAVSVVGSRGVGRAERPRRSRPGGRGGRPWGWAPLPRWGEWIVRPARNGVKPGRSRSHGLEKERGSKEPGVDVRPRRRAPHADRARGTAPIRVPAPKGSPRSALAPCGQSVTQARRVSPGAPRGGC